MALSTSLPLILISEGQRYHGIRLPRAFVWVPVPEPKDKLLSLPSSVAASLRGLPPEF